MKFQRKESYFLIALFIFQIIVSYLTWLVDDEAYYWVWSNHMAWGYFDHPPMVALFIKLSYALFHNMLGVRFLSIISFFGFLFIWRAILEPKNLKELVLFYAIFLSFSCFQIYSFITTPDVPLMLFGSLYLLGLKKFISKQNISNTLLLALSMALVMYSKYFGILLIVFSLLPIYKIWFKNIYFYLAVLISLVLYFPHIYWQMQNNWVSLNYHLADRDANKSFSLEKFFNYLLGFIVLGSLPLWLLSKSLFTKISKNTFHKALQFIALGTFVLFLILAFTRKIQPQWNLIIYLAIAGLAYDFLKNKNSKTYINALWGQAFLLLILKGIIAIPSLPTPMFSLKQFVVNAQQYVDERAVFERYQHTAAYTFYNQERAYCYRVYNHRKSQYGLWQDEDSLQGKNFTSFGLERFSNDTILDNYGKYENVHEVIDFHSFPLVEITLNSAKNSDEEYEIDCTIYNPYVEDIVLDNANQQLLLIGFTEKYHPEFTYVLNSSKIIIPAKDHYQFYTNFKMDLHKDYTEFALGLKPPQMSGKKQSAYFRFQSN